MKIKRAVMSAIVAVAAFCGVSRDASAGAAANYYGVSSESFIVIGRDPNDGNSHWIGWKRISDGACAWQQIGSSSGLTEDWVLTGSNVNDSLMIVSSGGFSFCGYTLLEPTQNGYRITIMGSSGNDSLYSGFSGDHALYGDSGHDFLWTLNSTQSYLEGGPHNDILASSYFGGGSGAELYGGNGEDCLYVNSSQSPATMNCGDGTDTWDGPGSRPATCDLTVHNCCGVFEDCE